MKVILSGMVASFRTVDIKGAKVGQADILQSGDERYPAKVISVYVPNSAACRVIMEMLGKYKLPIVSLLIYLREGRELELELMEIMAITAGEGVEDLGRDAD